MSKEALITQIRDAAVDIASDLGLYVYDLDLTRGRQLRIRLFAERLGKKGKSDGITISECARLSRQLERTLELEGVVGPMYVLEVSSPGVERELKTSEHFENAVGEPLRVVLSKNHGDRVVEGELAAVDDETITLKVNGGSETVKIDQTNVKKAQTIFKT